MSEIRCIIVVDAGATRSVANWDAIVQAVRNKPMVLAVRVAANRHDTPYNNININRFSVNPVRRYRLGDFEVSQDDGDELLDILNTQAAARNVTGNVRTKFGGVVQAELRESAVDLGFGAIAPLIVVTVIGFAAQPVGELSAREVANAEARTYLAANAAIWELSE